ncbi:MAG: hypothetical protein WHV67_05970 [Thermoanaerobaculia bacterium]
MKRLEKIKILTLNFTKNFMRSRAGKSLIYFIPLFFLIMLLSLSSSLSPEKLFLNLGSSILYLVILFLSIFSSCESITGEIKENTIQFLFTKPLKPGEIIISKWLSVNLITFTTLFSYLLVLHFFGLIFFKKYFFSLDISIATLFLGSLLLSSFTFFLTTLFPSISTAIFILIFGTGLIDVLLKALLAAKTYNLIGLIAKKVGAGILYFFFYLFPSFNNVTLEADEILLNKTFWKGYLVKFFYVIFCSIFYLLLSIYIFKVKRKIYFKSI